VTSIDAQTIQKLLGAMLWALGRVSGLCLVVPVFSDAVVPRRIRVAVIMLLTGVMTPMATATIDPLTGEGIITLVREVLVGGTMGFALKLVFEAVSLGGQLVGQTMSLGFAETVDPATHGSSPVISQFYVLLVTLLFLTMNGHLQLIALLAESFRTLPPGTAFIGPEGFHAVVAFAVHLFSGALRVALPALSSLLLVNIGFAAISRAAPSMNLFAVGFPITVSLGMVALWLSLRSVPAAFDSLYGQAWSLMRDLVQM